MRRDKEPNSIYLYSTHPIDDFFGMFKLKNAAIKFTHEEFTQDGCLHDFERSEWRLRELYSLVIDGLTFFHEYFHERLFDEIYYFYSNDDKYIYGRPNPIIVLKCYKGGGCYAVTKREKISDWPEDHNEYWDLEEKRELKVQKIDNIF